MTCWSTRDNSSYSTAAAVVFSRVTVVAISTLTAAVCHETALYSVTFYRAMHYSEKRGAAIACHWSVCPSVTLVDHEHSLEILETNCTDN